MQNRGWFALSGLVMTSVAVGLLVWWLSPDDRPDRARALVREWAETLDGQTDETGGFLRHQGATANDPWGRPLDISYSEGGFAETLTVRSAGPDGVSYTDDDIIEKRTKVTAHGIGRGIKKNTAEMAEKAGEGLSKGVIKGVKEELRKKGAE